MPFHNAACAGPARVVTRVFQADTCVRPCTKDQTSKTNPPVNMIYDSSFMIADFPRHIASLRPLTGKTATGLPAPSATTLPPSCPICRASGPTVRPRSASALYSPPRVGADASALMASFRQTSATGKPSFACLKTKAICASANFDALMEALSQSFCC